MFTGGLGEEEYVARLGIPHHTLVLTSPLLSLSSLIHTSIWPQPSFQPSSMASSSSSSPELPLSRSTNNNDQFLHIDHKLHQVLEDLSRSVARLFIR